MKRKSKNAKVSKQIYKDKNMIFGYAVFSSIMAIGILLIAGYYSFVPLPTLNVLPATGTSNSCTFTLASQTQTNACSASSTSGHYTIADFKSGTVHYALDLSNCTGSGTDLVCATTTISSQY